ncbi:hypothetical protein Vafri_7506, partial [Volvox africanus]
MKSTDSGTDADCGPVSPPHGPNPGGTVVDTRASLVQHSPDDPYVSRSSWMLGAWSPTSSWYLQEEACTVPAAAAAAGAPPEAPPTETDAGPFQCAPPATASTGEPPWLESPGRGGSGGRPALRAVAVPAPTLIPGAPESTASVMVVAAAGTVAAADAIAAAMNDDEG